MSPKKTINDVAAHAGVSIKTVSRVINNEANVRKSTFDKVQKAIQYLNYRPNNSARSLASHSSYTIAFIYDNPNAYYVIDMQNGILSSCHQSNYELLIHPCDHRQIDLESEIINLINQSRIAGVVLTPPFSEMPSILALLERLKIFYVRIVSGQTNDTLNTMTSDNPINERSTILIDDFNSAFSLTEHLIGFGHKKIGFLCGGREHQSSIERLNGFRAALQKYQLKIEPSFILDGEYSFDSGVKGANELLSKRERPTAIFASNDEIAAGVLFEARLKGLSIPAELSIVGFEDSPYSRQTSPQLTTARQPNKIIAEQATNLLIANIQGKSPQYIQDKKLNQNFKPKLILRESSGQVF